MELKDVIRKYLKLDAHSYYWEEWRSALDHDPLDKSHSEFAEIIWGARQHEIDELKRRLSLSDLNLKVATQAAQEWEMACTGWMDQCNKMKSEHNCRYYPDSDYSWCRHNALKKKPCPCQEWMAR